MFRERQGEEGDNDSYSPMEEEEDDEATLAEQEAAEKDG
jgi:hypothetical protein